MRSSLLLLLAAGLLSHPLPAQTVVRPQEPLGPAKAEVRDALVGLRDSLIHVESAASRITDRGTVASDALLRSRARAVAVACERAGELIPGARATVADGAWTREEIATEEWEKEYIARRQGELLQRFDVLAPAVERCAANWRAMSQPDRVNEVRTAGGARANALRETTREFQYASDAFLKAIGIRVRPRGAGPSPLD